MKKSKKAVRKPSSSKPVITHDLCIELVAMAGFVEDRRVRERIYKAVRQLQILDKLVADAPTRF